MPWGFFGYVLTKERQHLRLLLLVSCCHAYPENESIIHFKSIKSNFFIIVLSRKIQFTTPESSCPREIIVFTYNCCFTVCVRKYEGNQWLQKKYGPNSTSKQFQKRTLLPPFVHSYYYNQFYFSCRDLGLDFTCFDLFQVTVNTFKIFCIFC